MGVARSRISLDRVGPIIPDLDLDGLEDVEPVRPASPRRRKTPSYESSPDTARKAIAKAGWAAIDLETKGLHPHASEDAAVGAILIKAGKQRFILRPPFPDWWPEMMADADTRKISANAKFDLMWQIEFAPGEDGLPIVRNQQDIMLKSQLVNRYRTKGGAERAGRADLWEPNDLASILKRHRGVEISKSIDHNVTDWTGPWSREMIEYLMQAQLHMEDMLERVNARHPGEPWQHAR